MIEEVLAFAVDHLEGEVNGQAAADIAALVQLRLTRAQSHCGLLVVRGLPSWLMLGLLLASYLKRISKIREPAEPLRASPAHAPQA